jgi:nitrate reductase gamma subunit
MREKWSLWGFFAHTGIIVGMMIMVFFAIDRYNPAMEFMTSEISKWLILLLALCAVGSGLYSAVLLFQMRQRQEERMSARHAAISRRQAYTPHPRVETQHDAARAGYAPARR